MYLARNRAGGTASILGDLWRYSLSLDLGSIRKRGVRCLQREYASSFLVTTVRSEAVLQTEFANHLDRVAVLAVDGFVHRAHVVRGDPSGQCMESNRNL